MLTTRPAVPTGFPLLDDVLPAGGWPVASVTEVITPVLGSGELRLLAPALRRLTHAGRAVALLVPPSLSYAPTLIQHGVDLKHVRVIRCTDTSDGLSSIEQALQASDFAAIAVWGRLSDTQDSNVVRMLQLAARLSQCPVVLFCAADASVRGEPAVAGVTNVQLRIETIAGNTIKLHRTTPAGSAPVPGVALDMPAPRMQARALPQLAQPNAGAADGAAAAVAPSPARRSMRDSIVHFATLLSTKAEAQAGAQAAEAPVLNGDAAPARPSWPFKQRRPSPDVPATPSPGRAGRFGLH